MRHLNRKTTPKVKDGKVQRKNRTRWTPNVWTTEPDRLVLHKEKPGRGYRHYLRKKDILEFVEIIPEWDELAANLRGIVLARHEENTAGWHTPGFVCVCAWERDPWVETSPGFYREHRKLYERLEVPCERIDDDTILCKFTPEKVRAYQLLHILLHELGHHHDRITTRSRRRASRGEDYAEQWAYRYEKLVWNRYHERFGW